MRPIKSPLFIIATTLYIFTFLCGFIGNSIIIATIQGNANSLQFTDNEYRNKDLALAVIAAPLRILEINYQ